MWHELFSFLSKYQTIAVGVLQLIGVLLTLAGTLWTVKSNRKADEEADEKEAVKTEHEARVLIGGTNTHQDFEMIFMNSPLAIILTNQNLTVRRWNPAACALFGYTEHDMIGRNVVRIIPHHLRSSHRAGFEHYLETGIGAIMSSSTGTISEGMHRNGDIFPINIFLTDGLSAINESVFAAFIAPIVVVSKAVSTKAIDDAVPVVLPVLVTAVKDVLAK